MRKLLLLLLTIVSTCAWGQHGFPDGHWVNTEQGWKTKKARALWGLKYDKLHFPIVIPHRGVWGKPNQPENSLRAVKDAYSAGYMFCEIDLVMSDGGVLVLCHDQQTNRMTSLPPTFNADGNLHDNGSFFRNIHWDRPTYNSIPNEIGIAYPTFPSLQSATYKDRFDNVTDQKLNRFEDILDFCLDKEILLTIDIKTGSLDDPAIKYEYMAAIDSCLSIAEAKNCLHQIIFKPGSSGQVTVQDLKNYLEPRGQWENFSKKSNVILINIIGGSFPNATNKQYLDDWFALPSLIGVEQIYKNPDDKLLQPNPEFGNVSILKYTQNKQIRTGVFHPIPTNELGAPGGRGNYFNPPHFGDINDLRGSLEFLFNFPSDELPGMVVTDRPHEDCRFMADYSILSKYTFRDGNY